MKTISNDLNKACEEFKQALRKQVEQRKSYVTESHVIGSKYAEKHIAKEDHYAWTIKRQGRVVV